MVNVSSPPPKQFSKEEKEKQKKILEQIKLISEQYQKGIDEPIISEKEIKSELREKLKTPSKEEHTNNRPAYKPEPLEEVIKENNSIAFSPNIPIQKTPSFSLPPNLTPEQLEKEVKRTKEKLDLVKKEVAKVVIGQNEVINHFIMGLIANAHVLVEGVPGIAKTLIVRAIATASGCQFGRIQFTPDLLPTDIIGVSIFTGAENGKKSFEILRGPIFNNFILADEINRAPPKVQSALLEAMQEHQVTIGRETINLAEPFFVFATQNPLEQAGVYTLPEAQLDRFLFKIFIGYPNTKEEKDILTSNITVRKFDFFDINAILNAEQIIKMQEITRKVYLNEELEKYIVRIIDATRNPDKYGLNDIKKYIEYGSSPRGSIGLFIGAKSNAILNGRTYVLPEDIIYVAKPVLRHRIILTYEGQAEGLTSDKLIEKILREVPAP